MTSGTGWKKVKPGGFCGIIVAGGNSLRFSGPKGMPKALAAVDGSPLLLHVAAGLAYAGASKILVLTGSNHTRLQTGLGLSAAEFAQTDAELKSAFGLLRIKYNDGELSEVPFELRFSGENAGTAGRLAAVARSEIGEVALLSYTDILSDADLKALLRIPSADIDIAMLAVQPRLPWGVLDMTEDGQVFDFNEKPMADNMWINGGVMAISSSVLDEITASNEMLEGTIVAHSYELNQ